MARRIESLYINQASGLDLNGTIITASTPVALNLPTSAGDLLTTTSQDTLKNKVLNDASNDVAANKLRSNNHTVALEAKAPQKGQVLTALNADTAAWQALSLPEVELSSAELTLEKEDSTALEKFKTEAQTVYYLNTHVINLHQENAAVFTLKAAFYHNGKELTRIDNDDLITFNSTSDKKIIRARDKNKTQIKTIVDNNQIQIQVTGMGKWKSSSQLMVLN